VPEAGFMPAGAFAAFAFRPEPEAWVPWLRYLAARDPQGPMRNLGFQLDDFQKRYGRDLRRDLCDAIGERGWLFLMKGEQIGSVSAVALIEAYAVPALEGTLADLLDWAGEQIWIDSLGTLLFRPWTRTENGLAARGIDLWTPFGKRTGFAFTLTGQYLVLASSEPALCKGLDVAARLPGLEATAPHASMRVLGAPIAKLFGEWLALAGRSDNTLMTALARLIAGIEEARVEVHYEQDAVRFRAHAHMGPYPQFPKSDSTTR
jgi:hypothetical protein